MNISTAQITAVIARTKQKLARQQESVTASEAELTLWTQELEKSEKNKTTK